MHRLLLFLVGTGVLLVARNAMSAASCSHDQSIGICPVIRGTTDSDPCNPVCGAPAPAPSQSPSPILGQVKYLGYWGVALGKLNAIQEVRSHTNTVWIGYGDMADPPGFGAELARMDEAASAGMKIVLNPQSIFFDWDAGTTACPFGVLSLKPDYQASWNTYLTAIRPYLGSVVAITPIDEPYSLSHLCVTMTAMKGYLDLIGATIKQSLPDVATYVNFDSNFMPRNQPMPRNYDWIGFDCYTSFVPSCGTLSTLMGYVGSLKERLSASQRIVLIPEAHFRSTTGALPTAAQQSQVNTLIQLYVQVAQSEPRVIGFFPFIWASFSSNPAAPTTLDYIGTRDMPAVRDYMQGVGDALLNPPAMPTPLPGGGLH